MPPSLPLLLRLAVLITASLIAIACSTALPTAPSDMNPTSPVATTMTTPVPAPVSQTLTGTWTGNGQTFTVTQNGTLATGMIAPRTTAVGSGETITRSTTIIGSVADLDVALEMTDRIVLRGTGTVITCTAGHAFRGTLAGNTLSGIMVDTTPFNCDGDAASVAVPHINGPVVYTRH